MNVKKIEEIIIQSFKENLDVEIVESDKNLFDILNIQVIDYLYVILDIKNKYHLPIMEVIQENDYKIFSIGKMAELLGEKVNGDL
jgi:hypothetical protein